MSITKAKINEKWLISFRHVGSLLAVSFIFSNITLSKYTGMVCWDICKHPQSVYTLQETH